MVVICEECGKIYHLDILKLKESIKKKTTRIKCRVCDHVIEIAKPEESHGGILQGISPEIGGVGPEEEMVDEIPAMGDTTDSDLNVSGVEPSLKKVPSPGKSGKSGLGLRTKMFFLFLFIPILFITGTGAFSQIQMLTLSRNITGESIALVKKLAEETIVNKAKSVAVQCSIFLKNNSDLNKDDFNYDLELPRIAIQNVGAEGYTALIELPPPGAKAIDYQIWCHRNSEYIGKSLFTVYKEIMSGDMEAYKKIFKSLEKGMGTQGYYTFKDSKGGIIERFIAVEPIEQTPYLIISTANINDFTKPVKDLEEGSARLTLRTRNINLALLTALILFMGLSISIYGFRLTNKIRLLTDAADRISVGELDVVIDINSSDEIGSLGEAITRMQDSLRVSIERLRRRR